MLGRQEGHVVKRRNAEWNGMEHGTKYGTTDNYEEHGW